MKTDGSKRIVLAVTGATGVILGIRVLEILLGGYQVHLIVSDSAVPIIRDELGVNEERTDLLIKTILKGRGIKEELIERVVIHPDDNLWAPVSSGSFKTDGMLVVPCSMKTLSAIATGYADSLITRVSDVTIKEGRPLILSPRETPLSPIHLENMLKLSRIGVKIVPPVMGFYARPQTIKEMIDFIVGKILDQLGMDHGLYKRWK